MCLQPSAHVQVERLHPDLTDSSSSLSAQPDYGKDCDPRQTEVDSSSCYLCLMSARHFLLFFWGGHYARSSLRCVSLVAGILVPLPGVESTSPALGGGFLATGPLEEVPLLWFLSPPLWWEVMLSFLWGEVKFIWDDECEMHKWDRTYKDETADSYTFSPPPTTPNSCHQGFIPVLSHIVLLENYHWFFLVKKFECWLQIFHSKADNIDSAPKDLTACC